MISFEYAVVEHRIERVRRKRELSRPKIESPYYWLVEESWNIRHPDGAIETLQGEGVSLDVVLNKMGSDGWELASAVVCERATGSSRGFPNVSYPIRTEYTMKRFKM